MLSWDQAIIDDVRRSDPMQTNPDWRGAMDFTRGKDPDARYS